MADDASRYPTREFSLTARDYADFAVFAETRSRFRRRIARWMLPFSIGPLAVVLDLAFGIHPNLFGDAGGWPGLVLLAFLLGGLVLALSRLTRPWIVRFASFRRFRDGTFDGFAKPQRIEISAEGVRFTGGTGESLSPWSSIADIAVTKKAIYIFVTSLNAYILPRRAFADADQYDEFVRRAKAFRAGDGRVASTT